MSEEKVSDGIILRRYIFVGERSEKKKNVEMKNENSYKNNERECIGVVKELITECPINGDGERNR